MGSNGQLGLGVIDPLAEHHYEMLFDGPESLRTRGICVVSVLHVVIAASCRIRGIVGGILLTSHSSKSSEELIRACAEFDDGAAWEEFVARFQRPISLSIKRTACQWGKDPAQFVDDLLQETYLKLCADKCRLLLQFAGQHSDEAVLGYIKTIAINVAHDHFKSLHSQKRGAGETDQLHEDFDPQPRAAVSAARRPWTAKSF